MKRCNKCKQLKSLKDFAKQKASRDGFLAGCKVCLRPMQIESRKRFLERHPNHVTDQRIKYRANHTVAYKTSNLLCNARGRAKRKNLEFNLDYAWVRENSSKACPLSGLKFDISVGDKTLYSPSIDRIDNKKGYTKENCRIILFGLNAFKGEGTDKNMLDIINATIKTGGLNG